LNVDKEVSGRFQQVFQFAETTFFVHSSFSKFQVRWNLLKLKAIAETSIVWGNPSFSWLKPDWNLKGVSAVRNLPETWLCFRQVSAEFPICGNSFFSSSDRYQRMRFGATWRYTIVIPL